MFFGEGRFDDLIMIKAQNFRQSNKKTVNPVPAFGLQLSNYRVDTSYNSGIMSMTNKSLTVSCHL